jgi:hypothetical protein
MRMIHRAAGVRRAGGFVIAATAALVGALVLLAGVLAAPADAHERRPVGDLVFVVGWGEEPAFTGFKNRVQAILSTADDEPITDTEAVDLAADVSIEGEEPVEVTMEPQFGENFGEPGDFGADLIPTRPGTYEFHFHGTVNGQQIDEVFTSGEETFDAPREPAEVQYPVADPSTAALNERLDRELARVAAEDDSGSDTGTILGIVGIAVAVIAVGGAGVALRRSRAGA